MKLARRVNAKGEKGVGEILPFELQNYMNKNVGSYILVVGVKTTIHLVVQ